MIAPLLQQEHMKLMVAKAHLEHATDNDLLLHDRNYASYSYLATISKSNKKFVIRCSAASFSSARKMLNGEGPDSQIVTLEPHHSKLKEIQEDDLPE